MCVKLITLRCNKSQCRFLHQQLDLRYICSCLSHFESRMVPTTCTFMQTASALICRAAEVRVGTLFICMWSVFGSLPSASARPAYYAHIPASISSRWLLWLSTRRPNPHNVCASSCSVDVGRGGEPSGCTVFSVGPTSKEKSWKCLNCFVVSSMQDGPRGDPGHGRGSVRREGGCVVTWHYLHRAG